MGTITIRGEFVNLRPLVESDARITFEWREGRRALLLNRGARNVNEQAQWIVSRPSNEFNFIIETKDSHPLGMLSLVAVDHLNRRGESARFLIGDEEYAKGIPAAVEAMKLLYEFAFDDLKLERIYGTIASDNGLMIKWQKYLGMKEEGRLRKHFYLDGRFQDAVYMGLLVDEYRKESLPRMKALMSVGRKADPQKQGFGPLCGSDE